MRIPARSLPAVVLSVLAGAVACAEDGADRGSLEAATRAWAAAYVAGDADAMAALATEDVILLDPDAAPIVGRKAALAAWRQSAAAARTGATITTKELVMAGDFAWQVGATGRNGAGWSQFLAIWKRDDGRWKIHRRMSSQEPAARWPAPRPLPSGPVLDEPGTRTPPSEGGRG